MRKYEQSFTNLSLLFDLLASLLLLIPRFRGLLQSGFASKTLDIGKGKHFKCYYNRPTWNVEII